MTQQMHRSIVAAAIALISMGSLHAQTPGNIVVDTQQTVNAPYLLDSQRIIVRNSTGQCWRTGYWTVELAAQTKVVGSEFPAGCACDEPLMPAGTCTRPAPVVSEPTPVPPPAPAPVPTSEKVTIPTDTLFEFDRSVLTPAGQDKLTAFSDQLKTLNLEAVVAVGHTDRIGSTQYNQALSERRAKAVKDFLVTQGVEAGRVFIEGRGESQPVTGEQCKNGKGAESGRNRGLVQCLAPDRRVDIEAVGTRR